MPFSELFERLKIDPRHDGHGEYARLFPALSEKGKEGRAASIFLACVAHIPEFAHELLAPLGRPIGKRSSLVALTEVQFPNADGERPDGLIAVRTGGSYWTSLLEFKVGGTLEKPQVERYLKVAKANGIDAVLTVSNDIVPTPDVSPVNVDGRLTRSTSLFHISWTQILAHLQLLVATDGIADGDHRMIVREFIRFLVHPSTGIKGYEQMPSEWGDVVDACRDRKALRRNGEDERSVVDGWIQEERELAPHPVRADRLRRTGRARPGGESVPSGDRGRSPRQSGRSSDALHEGDGRCRRRPDRCRTRPAVAQRPVLDGTAGSEGQVAGEGLRHVADAADRGGRRHRTGRRGRLAR